MASYRIQVLKNAFRRLLHAPSVDARHIEPSAVLSLDDDPNKPDKVLIDLVNRIIPLAWKNDCSKIGARLKREKLINTHPGEHYCILDAIVSVMKPLTIVEVGTAEGLSALALKQSLPHDGEVVTFDLIPWNKYDRTALTSNDFADERLRQHIGDLSDISIAQKHKDLLQRADLFFIDAMKDGKMEKRLLNVFRRIGIKEGAILVFDDIRLWTMLKFWRNIALPKIDITSFGHWTGTGLVRWKNQPRGGSNK